MAREDFVREFSEAVTVDQKRCKAEANEVLVRILVQRGVLNQSHRAGVVEVLINFLVRGA
jgi:hypothetical protein